MKKLTIKTAQELITKKLIRRNDLTIKDASKEHLYNALAAIAVDAMLEKREKFNANSLKKKDKMLHYLSIEFLMGKSLRNNLFNLGLSEVMEKVLKSEGVDINDVYDVEHDAGLGNGGLGRLAACFLDSLAKLGYPAFGHSIRYEYGLFNQKIVDGKQIETPDEWLDTGNVWLEPREDEAIDVSTDITVLENMLKQEDLI